MRALVKNTSFKYISYYSIMSFYMVFNFSHLRVSNCQIVMCSCSMHVLKGSTSSKHVFCWLFDVLFTVVFI